MTDGHGVPTAFQLPSVARSQRCNVACVLVHVSLTAVTSWRVVGPINVCPGVVGCGTGNAAGGSDAVDPGFLSLHAAPSDATSATITAGDTLTCSSRACAGSARVRER